MLEPAAAAWFVEGAKIDTLGVTGALDPARTGIVAEDLHKVVDDADGEASAQEARAIVEATLAGLGGTGAVDAPFRDMNEVGDRTSPGRGESCAGWAIRDSAGRVRLGRSCAFGTGLLIYTRTAGAAKPGDAQCIRLPGCTATLAVDAAFGHCCKADAARADRLSAPLKACASLARRPYGPPCWKGLLCLTGLIGRVGLCGVAPRRGEFKGEPGTKPGCMGMVNTPCIVSERDHAATNHPDRHGSHCHGGGTTLAT